MKAAVLHAKRDLRVEDIEGPIPGARDVIVKVMASGVCGSDIPRVLGDGSHYYPNVFGHEFSGIVTALGEKVTHLSLGDRVTAAPLIPCHKCEDCLQGNYSLCKHYSFVGSREYGAWAEYVKVPEQNAVLLPESCSYIQGAFVEPLTVALHGLFLMDFKPMSRVAITGMGTIGLLALQCARRMGAKEVTVFDVDPSKLEKAKQLGADYCVNTKVENASEVAKKLTDGKGYEMVIEAAGVPQTELLCLELAGPKASVMYIGTPHKEFTIQPRQFEYMNRKELKLGGSWMSYSSPYPGKEWTLAAHYLGTGEIKIEPLLDRIISIDQLWEAFCDFDQGRVSGKIMMRFDQEAE